MNMDSERGVKAARRSKGGKPINLLVSTGPKDSAKMAKKKANKVLRDIEAAVKKAHKVASKAKRDIRDIIMAQPEESDENPPFHPRKSKKSEPSSPNAERVSSTVAD